MTAEALDRAIRSAEQHRDALFDRREVARRVVAVAVERHEEANRAYCRAASELASLCGQRKALRRRQEVTHP